MEMTGEHRIEAPRERVWQALNDPEILKQCIPGCQELNQDGDNAFSAKVKVKVGPVSAKFSGKVELSDLKPPESYTISGEGTGGPAGFAKGGAKVQLAEDGAATRLSYQVEAQIGGKLAQIGSRLIDGTAKKLANQFFSDFAAAVGTSAEPGNETVAQEEDAKPSESEESEMAQAAVRGAALGHTPPDPSAGGGLSPGVWVTGLIVVVGLLLLIFTIG